MTVFTLCCRRDTNTALYSIALPTEATALQAQLNLGATKEGVNNSREVRDVFLLGSQCFCSI